MEHSTIIWKNVLSIKKGAKKGPCNGSELTWLTLNFYGPSGPEINREQPTFIQEAKVPGNEAVIVKTITTTNMNTCMLINNYVKKACEEQDEN